MKTYLHRASNLKSTITFMAEVSFWRQLENAVSCDVHIIIIIIIIIVFFRLVSHTVLAVLCALKESLLAP